MAVEKAKIWHILVGFRQPWKINNYYRIAPQSRRKLTGIICAEFAAVSRGIWQTGLRNLEKFAAENCGP